MGSERTHVDKYLCTVCGHRHSNGWYCKHSIDAKDGEIEILKRAMDLRYKDSMKLIELHNNLEVENAALKAQLAASDGRVMVAETMLADFYWRAKRWDVLGHAPIDRVPAANILRHIVWQYETVMKVATLGNATDAANGLQ